MGQTTHGILYGVKADNNREPDAYAGEDGDGGLLGDYATHCKPMVAALATRLQKTTWSLQHRFAPDAEWIGSEDARFIGFWISRGASEGGLEGAVLMSTKAVRLKYPKAYRRARRRWRRFAKFCEQRCFPLQRAQLWLVETEVA